MGFQLTALCNANCNCKCLTQIYAMDIPFDIDDVFSIETGLEHAGIARPVR